MNSNSNSGLNNIIVFGSCVVIIAVIIIVVLVVTKGSVEPFQSSLPGPSYTDDDVAVDPHMALMTMNEEDTHGTSLTNITLTASKRFPAAVETTTNWFNTQGLVGKGAIIGTNEGLGDGCLHHCN